MAETVYLLLALISGGILLLILLLGTVFDVIDEGLEALGADLFPDGGFSKGYFSVKAILAFFAMTGAVGYMLTQYGMGGITTFISAIIAGTIIGVVVGTVMKSMTKINASSHLIDADFTGVSGRVTAGIPEGSFGEVTTTVRGQTMYLSAKSEDGNSIRYGTAVEVVRKEGNVAVVRPTE